MAGDFTKVLARAQTDYDFYIECQRDPEGALSGFDLRPEEHAALCDPQTFADALARGGDLGLPTGVKITISGTHDWVNRTAPPTRRTTDEDAVAHEVKRVQQTLSEDERRESALRLIQLLG